MITFKQLWRDASKKYKTPITDKDFIIIVVASAVSGGVSVLLSEIDWSKLSFTGVLFLDFILSALILSGVIAGIVYLLFKILRWINVFGEFLTLVWKKWGF